MNQPVEQEETERLTKQEAIDLVGGKSEYIHCFKNPNGMLLGADWAWEEFEKELEIATRLAPSGPMAEKLNHPLAVFSGGRWMFFGKGL